MVKNIIIVALIGLLTISQVLASVNGVVCNKIDKTGSGGGLSYVDLFTTKTVTPEGTYRIFIYDGYKSGGISVIKIK